MAWMVQLVPFQRSASARLAVLASCCPAAVQAPADVHDTLRKMVPNVPAGLGVAWTVQLVPFQASASASVVWALFS